MAIRITRPPVRRYRKWRRKSFDLINKALSENFQKKIKTL